MNLKLSQLGRPFLCADLSELTIASFARRIDQIESSAKVDSFEINLAPLKRGRLRDIFSLTNKPCIVTNRRLRLSKSYGFPRLPNVSECERVRRMLEALDAGAAAIDIEIDIFDYHGQRGKPAFGSTQEAKYARNPHSRPVEWTENRTAIRDQENVIAEIHEIGCEVLMSCHSQLRTRSRIALQLSRTMERRGADFAKVVMMTFDRDDIVEMLNGVMNMKRTLKIPFNLLTQGEGARIGRLLSAAFGSAWIFCRLKSGFAYHGQPTITEAREFLRNFSFT